MPSVLLVTCDALPDGEPGGEHLLAALAARGVDARWVSWSDAAVDWTAADLVAVRATWDYDARLEDFLAWTRRLEEPGVRVLNGGPVFRWNLDKAYLVELAATGLEVVPTVAVDGEEDLPPAIARFGEAVVKPRIGAGGRGVVVFDLTDGGPADLDESQLRPGPWVVQPLVASVRTEGESSVFVLDGRPVSRVDKRPSGGDIRVHEEYGGTARPVDLDPEHGELAQAAVAAASELLGVPLPYARADLLRLADGTLALSELELVEPGLYLDVRPENAGPFADLVERRLRTRG